MKTSTVGSPGEVWTEAEHSSLLSWGKAKRPDNTQHTSHRSPRPKTQTGKKTNLLVGEEAKRGGRRGGGSRGLPVKGRQKENRHGRARGRTPPIATGQERKCRKDNL